MKYMVKRILESLDDLEVSFSVINNESKFILILYIFSFTLNTFTPAALL